MIERVVRKLELENSDEYDDIRYWLSRTPQERIEVLESLNSHEVEYLIVGAFALAAFLLPPPFRATVRYGIFLP